MNINVNNHEIYYLEIAAEKKKIYIFASVNVVYGMELMSAVVRERISFSVILRLSINIATKSLKPTKVL